MQWNKKNLDAHKAIAIYFILYNFLHLRTSLRTPIEDNTCMPIIHMHTHTHTNMHKTQKLNLLYFTKFLLAPLTRQGISQFYQVIVCNH